MSIQTINPATSEVIETYPEMSIDEVNPIIKKVDETQKEWSQTDFKMRRKYLEAAADLLLKNKNQYAKLITTEMGKPIKAAIGEVEKCALLCRYYAENSEDFLKPKTVKTNLTKSSVIYRPLGTLFAIMPWNYPFWQVFRFAAPNLMAGNGCLLSHAPISTGAAFAIEKLFREAGFPENIFRAVVITNDTAKHIVQHDHIHGVTLTGSERAGRAVGVEAATALKKVVLELGGSDPYVVLADADLALAADQIVKSRLNNSGQVCIAAKRVIADAVIYEKLFELIKSETQSYELGDPMDPETKLGPLARADLRDTVHTQVQSCIEKGAKLICGGEIPEGKGFYYPPTILANIKPGMPAYDDEIFGPVIAIIKATDEDNAISIANDTRYGLSAAVFTQDIERGEMIASNKIHVGVCYVNGLVTSDPSLPFGGIKASGHGRELASEGIREFVNIKTVCVV